MQRILVVDDDRVVADTLKLIFRQQGFACNAAYSTEEALALAREFPPDLLLCDITMPDRDGLELMQEMRREHPNCRVLVLTGYTYNAQRVIEESGSHSYPVGVLTKPCQPAKLLREAGAMLA
jgi:CheY-like chemotaxis protein